MPKDAKTGAQRPTLPERLRLKITYRTVEDLKPCTGNCCQIDDERGAHRSAEFLDLELVMAGAEFPVNPLERLAAAIFADPADLPLGTTLPARCGGACPGRVGLRCLGTGRGSGKNQHGLGAGQGHPADKKVDRKA